MSWYSKDGQPYLRDMQGAFLAPHGMLLRLPDHNMLGLGRDKY